MGLKIKLIMLCLAFSIGCSNKHSKDIGNDDKIFTELLSKFDSLKLPFVVIGLDLANYTEKAWIERNDSTILAPNPLLKPIEGSLLSFVNSEDTMMNHYRFYGVYIKKLNEFNLAVIQQKRIERDEFWLKLNVYNLKWELIDTLTFAGQKVGLYNQYGTITPDLYITTLAYHDVEQDTTNLKNYYAMEIRNEYTISKEGRFTIVKSKNERGYFTTYGENNVVSRVDTIEGKYRH